MRAIIENVKKCLKGNEILATISRRDNFLLRTILKIFCEEKPLKQNKWEYLQSKEPLLIIVIFYLKKIRKYCKYMRQNLHKYLQNSKLCVKIIWYKFTVVLAARGNPFFWCKYLR